MRALVRVGQAVKLAVERFVTVGEAIAEENADIQQDMCDCCKEARLAGTVTLVTVVYGYVGGQVRRYCNPGNGRIR